MSSSIDWPRLRNGVIGVALGVTLLWAFKRDTSFGASMLAALGAVLAITLGAAAIKKLRQKKA